MIAGKMSRFRRGLTWTISGLVFCWFAMLFAILAMVIARDFVRDGHVGAVVPCIIAGGIWSTASILQVRWLRGLIWAFRYEDGVLWAQTFASWGERAFPLTEIAGVEQRKGRGGNFTYFRLVLRGRVSLIVDPALTNGVELGEQLRFDLGYGVPSGNRDKSPVWRGKEEVI